MIAVKKPTLENHVAQYRKAAGQTQQELAEAIEVTRQTIIAIEKGNYTPSVQLAMVLAKHFNVSIEELFYES